jgi:hypothetical protein
MTLNEAIAALKQGKMKPWKSEYIKKGLDQGEYWFYYRIANKTGKPIETAFDAFSNKADFHVIRPNGKNETYTTGDNLSWNKKTEFRNSNIAPVMISKDETIEVYYHASLLNTRFVKSFKVAMANPDRYARKYLADNERLLVRGEEQTRAFYGGIYLITALIYFVFFFLVREKVFLYFALFVLFLYYGNANFQTELIRKYPDTAAILNMLSVLIAFVFFLHFIRQYLNTKKYLPRWDKFLIAFSFIFLILGAVEAFSLKNSEDSDFIEYIN